MTIFELEAAMIKLAAGRFWSMQYERIYSSTGGPTTTVCRVGMVPCGHSPYVSGMGPTWHHAYEDLAKRLVPPVEETQPMPDTALLENYDADSQTATD